MNGVLILNKPQGMTSFDCVAKARRIFNTRKVGHAGTLDPMATGVLPILVGNAVKAEQFLHESNKVYRAKMLFGISTDTGDVTGSPTLSSEIIPDIFAVKEAAASFLGGYMQVPPMYSALKINGKKLYELARENIQVKREARFVGIDKLEVFPCDEKNSFIIEVSCSKGTYIRTLIEDIAKKAGSVATMSGLERRYCGGFDIKASHTLTEVLESRDPQALLVPTEMLFDDLRRVKLAPFFYRLALNGQPVFLKKLGINDLSLDQRVTVYSDNDELLGLAQVINSDEGTAIKVIKQFLS